MKSETTPVARKAHTKRADRNPEAQVPETREAERFLKAIANSWRLLILCELSKGEACVSKIQCAVGLNQSALSQHLARLRQDLLVKTRRESQTIHYSIADERTKQAISLVCDLFRRAK